MVWFRSDAAPAGGRRALGDADLVSAAAFGTIKRPVGSLQRGAGVGKGKDIGHPPPPIW